MIYTNTVTAHDELTYSDSTLARLTKFRESLEQQKNSLDYWQRHSDE